METLSQDSVLECQICFNYFSPRRRPKLLACRHTCCSVCLQQLRAGQRDVRCPWCRGLTRLPPGFSVAQLPDDPEALAALAIPHASEHSPVFLRLPSSGCYVLPLPLSKERALLPGAQQKPVPGVPAPSELQALPAGAQPGPGPGPGAAESGEAQGAQGRHGGGGGARSSTWSGVCTVVLVACVLVFLLGIVLHNMSCISKRFTVISCG